MIQALEKYFTDVFTANELGALKPDPGFYHAVLHACGYAASDVVLVGDNYQADVVSAKQAVARVIWYNPSGFPGKIHFPLYDAQIQTMSELPATFEILILHGEA